MYIWQSIFTVELVKTGTRNFFKRVTLMRCCVSNNSKLLVENRLCFASIFFSFLSYEFFEKFSNFLCFIFQRRRNIYTHMAIYFHCRVGQNWYSKLFQTRYVAAFRIIRNFSSKIDRVSLRSFFPFSSTDSLKNFPIFRFIFQRRRNVYTYMAIYFHCRVGQNWYSNGYVNALLRFE